MGARYDGLDAAPLRSDATTGFWAIEGGSIEAQDSTITGMWNGVLAGDRGYVECDRCAITGTAGTIYVKFSNVTNSTSTSQSVTLGTQCSGP